MQIKFYSLILLFFSQITYISGQVILRQSDTPKYGSTMVMSEIYDDTSSLNNYSFSKFGINNIWDFTKLPKERFDTINFIDPKTLNCDSFESATLALKYNNKEGPAFYRIDNNGMYVLGDKVTFNPWAGEFERRFRPDQLTKVFPYKFGDSLFSQVSSCTQRYRGMYDGLNFDSVYHILNYATKTKVVASGSIILPTGTYPAILERIDVVYRDSIIVLDSLSHWISYNSPNGTPWTLYHWYVNGSLWHVARIVQSYADYNDYIEYAESIIITGLGKELIRETDLSFHVIQELRKLKIGYNDKLIESKYSIGNVFGQQILLTGVFNGDLIDISSLSPGIYYFHLQTKNNSEFINKFIVF